MQRKLILETRLQWIPHDPQPYPADLVDCIPIECFSFLKFPIDYSARIAGRREDCLEDLVIESRFKGEGLVLKFNSPRLAGFVLCRN